MPLTLPRSRGDAGETITGVVVYGERYWYGIVDLQIFEPRADIPSRV